MKRSTIKLVLIVAILLGGFYLAQIVRYTNAGLQAHGLDFQRAIREDLTRQGFASQAKRMGFNLGYAVGCSMWTFEPDRKACFELTFKEDDVSRDLLDAIRKSSTSICRSPDAKDISRVMSLLNCKKPSKDHTAIKITILIRRAKEVIRKEIIEIREIQ